VIFHEIRCEEIKEFWVRGWIAANPEVTGRFY